MGTSSSTPESRLVASLANGGWADILRSIEESVRWVVDQPLGASETEVVIASLAALASHSKWEVRRAIAIAAGNIRHRALGDILPRLLADPNTRVAEAAQASRIRRRDWRSTGALGREHESRLDRMLAGIDERYGVSGRVAVQRAAAEMMSTFSRELYHEVVRHLTPLQREIAKMQESVARERSATVLATHAKVVRQDLDRLVSVLKGMREYAAAPIVEFAEDFVHEVVDESIRTVDDIAEARGVVIENRVAQDIVSEVSRVRLVQALSNLFHNALDSYDGIDRRNPIVVEGSTFGEMVRLTIEDRGCGMSTDSVRAARKLFVTNKAHGNGIGLPLAIKIVDSEHDGELTITAAEGKGTTVTITLPRFQRSE